MEKQLKEIIFCFKKKTTFSLKCAFFIFALALTAFSVYIMSLRNEQVQMQENFYENKNTHIIKINSRMKNDTEIAVLSFEDTEEIKRIVEQHTEGKIDISNEYAINFGISDGSQSYFLYALEDEMYHKLGMEFTDKYDAFYTDLEKTEKVELKIPVIEVNVGGYSSKDTESIEIKRKPLDDTVKSYLDGNLKKLYITKEMYENIIEKMYGIPYKDFVADYENSSEFGINAINRILVYVDEFSDVEAVADAISAQEYNVDYTLSAFDDLNGSLQIMSDIGIFVLVLFLFITAGNMLLSTEIYLRNNKKDMGILLHYGYDASNVTTIYTAIFRELFMKVFLMIGGISIVSVVGLFRKLQVWDVLLVVSSAAAVIILVYIIIYIRIKMISRLNILDLLRYSKESE